MSKKKYLILLFLCLIIAMTCSYGLWNEVIQVKKAQEFYLNINSKRNHLYTEKESTSPKKKISDETISSNNLSQKNEWLMELRKEYQDMVGWIRCEEIQMDYPIMQTDDNSYYLNHLPDGSYNKLGSIFLDRNDNGDFSSEVSIIYGHMMKDGEMFGMLKNYRKQDFYDKHSELKLYTEDGEKTIKLLAAYLVDGSSNPFPKGFDTSDEFYSYIQEIQRKSFFKSEDTAVSGDKLIILSTCAYDFDEARLAIVGYVTP